MIAHKTIENEDAGIYSHAAARDAAIKNYIASTQFSDAEKVGAESIRVKLSELYEFSEIYINYRAGKASKNNTHNSKFISIKMQSPYKKDKNAIRQYQTHLETQYKKIEVITSLQTNSEIYRLYC